VADARELYEKSVAEKLKEPETNVMEALHEAAWFNNTLGRPLYAPTHALDRVRPFTLQ
jgi:hypothetical protein